DVAGTPFAKSWWHWLTLRLGAVPTRIWFRGSVTVAVDPLGYTLGAKIVLATAADDEQAARKVLAGTLGLSGATTDLVVAAAAATSGSTATVAFDMDVTGFLQNFPNSKPLYKAAVMDPPYMPRIPN